ncbi:MAG TPA: alcohol dehydrogenase [Alphaproteobacteria bacterium]|nr:alcohol dehydrogenase [Alphaproteobacteria bacterium]HAM48907.1 alcohol dehydrogenase [Alphaproteobacteria bacterium]HBC53427.1 alcohol dehydrogenase [Alphaproteobacteria bacterium]HCO90066.1 alcohol dehydrogenase [Alphaproteobacteria bacterium]
MKAAILREVKQPLQIEQAEISKPGPREVLIRTVAVGVCHSDVHMADGAWPMRLPTIPGHEAAGIVEQVGADVTYVKPGDHVITCPSVFCGHCEHCLTGHMSLCTSKETQRGRDEEPRLTLDGRYMTQFGGLSAFAEKMLVHEHALVKIREDMPLDRAALIGCGVMTGAGAAINTAKVEPGSTVAVIGCGGIGLSAINGAAIAGAGRIIAIDMLGAKLNLARQFGATDVIDASQGNVVEQVRELTGGGVHYSFEAIGLKQTAEDAFKMVGTGGVATVIGMIPMGTMVAVHGAELLQEKRLQGSLMGSNRFRVDMPRLVDFYLDGRLHLDEMISDHIRLEDINQAFDNLREGGVARQIIMMDS